MYVCMYDLFVELFVATITKPVQSKRFYRHNHSEITVPLPAKEVHPASEHDQEYQGCL